MATRVLPGAYVTLNDLSQFPEGQTSLVVGYVLKCNRGDTEKPFLVTSPSDFLAKTTLTGVPSISDDPTYWSILKVLAQTNQVYIARAANNPLYGGAVLGATVDYGYVTAASATDKTITVSGSAPTVGDRIMVTGTNAVDGVYTVSSVAGKVVTVEESIEKDYPSENGTVVSTSKVAKAPVQPLPNQKIADVAQATSSTNTFKFANNKVKYFAIGAQFQITGASETTNNKVFTVEEISTTVESNTEYTLVKVKEAVADSSGGGSHGAAYNFGLTEDEVKALEAGTFTFGSELMRIVGVNPGVYNGQLGFTIVSWADTDRQDELVYENTMRLDVIDMNTGNPLESFTFSLDETAKTIDGASLYFGNVVNQASSYIRIYNKEGNTTLPNSTFEAPVKGGNGTNGGEISAEVLGKALDLFNDKTIPVSIIGNGCSAQAETKDFQSRLIRLAEDRKDIMVFLTSRKTDEAATNNTTKATNIVSYKKDLGSTSFYGTMYAPHVNTSDTFNSRQVKIGSDAVAIAGWLNVINNLNYPYAYAGPQNGLVTGVTCDWKIGDESGEAQVLNDASINYVAYDGKVGRYYMQCQNTLQVANSSFRNIGCVLNVLDIKENLAVFFKEYSNLPITSALRRDILNKINDYLSPMLGTRFYNYAFQDVTTDADIAQDTLRYLLTISLTRYAAKIYCAINVVGPTYDFSMLTSA